MSGLLYELWDYRTGNCIGAYEDEAAALADVRDTVNRYGAASAANLVLLSTTDDDEEVVERIAASEELIQRAEAAAPRVSHSR
jgi:hypothetical protein